MPFEVAFILLLHQGSFFACSLLSPLSAPYLDFFIGRSSPVGVPRLTFPCPTEVKMARVDWGSKGHPLANIPLLPRESNSSLSSPVPHLPRFKPKVVPEVSSNPLFALRA